IISGRANAPRPLRIILILTLKLKYRGMDGFRSLFPGRSGKWMFASVPSPRDTLTLSVGVGTVRLFGRIMRAFWGAQRQTAPTIRTASRMGRFDPPDSALRDDSIWASHTTIGTIAMRLPRRCVATESGSIRSEERRV